MREQPEKTTEEKIEEILCLNAPVLTGLKPSAIINVSEQEYLGLRRLLQGSSLKLLPLYMDQRVSLLLYREEKLRSLLSEEKLRRCLTLIDRSYEEQGMQQVLRLFRERFRAYKEKRRDFPHEVGFLLGYPVRDVLAYMERKGLGAIVTGYWKVYFDLPSALQTFQAYDVSIRSFQLMLAHGIPVEQLLEIYPERRRWVA